MDWYQKSSEFLLPTYDRIPVHFTDGQGVYLWDGQDNCYLDALAGIAVNILGYAHPRIVRSIESQADRVHHVSNLFEIKSQTQLAQRLNELGFESALFFCNSGAEANESAIKLARKRAYETGQATDSNPPVVLSLEGSFHGRTQGALAATGQPKYHKNFGPLPEGFETVPYQDETALDEAFDEFNVAAVMVESVQGEGGVRPVEGSYLRDLEARCDRNNALLIFDEVQAGMGRTGHFFGFEPSGVQPDAVTLAKGLGGGLPIGALMVHSDHEEVFTPGDHASTFGGNPFVTSVSLDVLTALEEENLIRNAAARGEQLLDDLADLAERFEQVGKPRGRGLMIGLPCREDLDASAVMETARDHGLIVGIAGGNVVRLVPPLILTEQEAGELVNRLEATVEELV